MKINLNNCGKWQEGEAAVGGAVSDVELATAIVGRGFVKSGNGYVAVATTRNGMVDVIEVPILNKCNFFLFHSYIVNAGNCCCSFIFHSCCLQFVCKQYKVRWLVSRSFVVCGVRSSCSTEMQHKLLRQRSSAARRIVDLLCCSFVI